VPQTSARGTASPRIVHEEREQSVVVMMMLFMLLIFFVVLFMVLFMVATIISVIEIIGILVVDTGMSADRAARRSQQAQQ